MLGELALRFVLGGAIVSAFAALGTVFKPKTFAGLFSAAPSVGIATLALAFAKEGGAYAATEARAMTIGALAMLASCAVCVGLGRRRGLPVWLSAGAAWLAWFAVAFGVLGLVRGVR